MFGLASSPNDGGVQYWNYERKPLQVSVLLSTVCSISSLSKSPMFSDVTCDLLGYSKKRKIQLCQSKSSPLRVSIYVSNPASCPARRYGFRNALQALVARSIVLPALANRVQTDHTCMKPSLISSCFLRVSYPALIPVPRSSRILCSLSSWAHGEVMLESMFGVRKESRSDAVAVIIPAEESP